MAKKNGENQIDSDMLASCAYTMSVAERECGEGRRKDALEKAKVVLGLGKSFPYHQAAASLMRRCR